MQTHGMGPINHPTHPPTSATTNNRSRRKPDLSLPVPQRQPSLPVPLPLPLPLPLPPPPSNTTATAATSSSSNQSAPLNQIPPLTLADLDREGRIGSGSGGTVYKVRHRSTGRSYALKVIYGNHEDSIRRQIRREIEILRTVDNPNVVKCHALFDNAGEIQVLLEYMDRGSLEGTRISDESFLADVARQILSGLSYLHRRKIVHRDIKPSNFLINSHSIVKIADFGVSRNLLQTMDPCQSSVGTIAYMSPERIDTDLNAGIYDGCAGDIWSFGVSMLEFYIGRFPFDVGRQSDWASLMCAICMSQPPEPPPSGSREFRHFVACCLQRDPANRWTALQLLRHPFILQNSVVRNAQQQVYRTPPPPPPPPFT